MRNKITLIGYMGSGKSTISRALSALTDAKIIDLDDWIEAKEHKSISKIFKTHGEAYFRKLETAALNEVFGLPGNYIVSLGGGTPCQPGNMALINKKSVSFYLKTSPETLFEHLKSEKEKRPLIAHLSDSELKEFIATHLKERSVFYEKAAHTVITDGKSPEEIAKEIRLLL